MRKYVLIVVVSVAIVSIVAYVLSNQTEEVDTSAGDYVAEAEKLLEKREYSKALEQYKLAINIDPSNTDVYLAAAEIYLQKSQEQEAIELLQNGEKTVTHPDRIHQKIGHILLDQGDQEGALTYLDQAKEENPNNWENLIDLTKALTYSDDKQNQLISDWENANITEGDGFTYKSYYLALLKSDNIDAAISHIQDASRTKRTDIEIGDSIDNLVSIFEQTKSEPDDVVQNSTLLAYEMIRAELFPYAIPLLEDVISENDEYYAAYMYLGVCYMRMNDLDTAKSNLSKATTVEPDEAQPWVFLAQVYTLQNNQKSAIDAYQQALTIDKDNEIIRYDFAKTLVAFGLYRQAQTEYRELIDRGSTNKNQYMSELIVILLDQLDEKQEALDLAKELADSWQGIETGMRDQKARGYDLLGWAYQKNDQKDDALKYLKQALELYPYLASNHYHFGVIYSEIGNITDAKIYLERAIDLDLDGTISPLATQELKDIQ